MKKLSTLFVTVALLAAFIFGGMGGHVEQAGATASAVEVYDGTSVYIANVTFGAGTDTFYSITHGITTESGVPLEVSIVPLDTNCYAGLNASGIVTTGGPIWNNPTSATTAVEIVKPSSGPSATCNIRVVIRSPHSIIR